MTFNKTCTPHSGLSPILLAVAWLFGGLTQPLSASECDTPVAQSVSVQGQVEVSAEGNPSWSPLKQQQWLCAGDRIRVGANSRAGLVLNDDTLLRLAENSSVRISAPSKEGNAWLDLLDGVAHFLSRVRHSFQVNTPYVNASIEGTEFTVQTSADGTDVTVLEGQVRATNPHGEVVVNGGERALAPAGKAPQVEAVVDPLEAVQWTLYYPPVAEAAIEGSSQYAQRSLESYRKGDLNEALSTLAQTSGIEQDPSLLVYRAGLYLRVGKVDRAQRDLKQALSLEPKQADALALMSTISTVNNKQQEALVLAQRAVEANPRGVSPLLALSYARQALFQLPEAMEAARQATEAAPNNSLAWTRLARLHLMFHELDKAAEAAWRSVVLTPKRSQSLTTLGFTYLLQLDLASARQAFEKAIALDQSADPLPRFGLGLLEIREGNLEEGRRQIEIAANLDPGNALIRSYLGKAYYEEKRDDKAATQFALSKRFDKRDPTPWYYDAILKQSKNNPIEALYELDTSIDLNDNRAVYRSRFLLDQDEAARNASQARIYQDLGFEQLARTEAYRSLQNSNQNHSAHRLLSDSYNGQPLLEKARMSELLQSQLLQPLNNNPIQPQLAVSKLGILDGAGPSASGLSEYTPMFSHDGLNFQLNGIGGSNGTAGDDMILSVLHGKIAFSLGQFHYETNGWRDNNDLEHDIYNAFLQFSPTPSTSVQLEYRRQEAESGDLAFQFERDDFSPFVRNDLKRRVGRIGVHHQFTPNSHLIASVIDQDLLETRSLRDLTLIPDFPIPGTTTTKETSDIRTSDSVSRTRELQFIQSIQRHSFTIGGGHFNDDHTQYSDIVELVSFPIPVPPFIVELPPLDLSDPTIFWHPQFTNRYLYSQLALPGRVNMTVGVTYEKVESSYLQSSETSPKFGLTWEALDNLTFRAAYVESLARPRHMEQTIEPTQVAGFNQLFDDIVGSEIEQFGFGADAKLNSRLSIGAEFNRRDLQTPLYQGPGIDALYESRDEKISRAYLYWTATERLGLHLAYEQEEFNREFFSPQVIKTQRTPVGLSYHWPSGIYLQSEGTYVDQEISRSGVTDGENFWNLDAVVGYRFPKRYGKAEIMVKNLLDKEFNYYDLSFHSGEFLTPRFQPERQVYARVTLFF